MNGFEMATMIGRRDDGNDTSCGFQGNNDIYGLGVRLGAYLQWLSTVLAYNLCKAEIDSMGSVNTCYQLALLISMVWFTVSSGSDLSAIEPYIALFFCFGGVCVSSIRALESIKDSHLGDLVNQILAVGVCVYGVWFLFVGLDGLQRVPGCQETAFFFAPVPLYGWYRVFLKVVFVMGLVAFSVLAFVILLKLIQGMIDWSESWTERVYRRPSLGPDKPEYLLSKRLFLGFLSLTMFVIAVELTISWNSIQGVYNCGSFSQLFPIVVGGSTFVRLLYKLGEAYWIGKLQLHNRR
jgi:hypothetical protein